MSFSVVFSLPQDSWFKSPETLHPFRSLSISQSQVAKALSQFQIKREKTVHAIVFAHKWKVLLNENPSLSVDEIALHQGLSDSRVRQILRLNKLDLTIQNFLENLSNPQEIRFFGDTRFAPLTSLSSSEQLTIFEQMKAGRNALN